MWCRFASHAPATAVCPTHTRPKPEHSKNFCSLRDSPPEVRHTAACSGPLTPLSGAPMRRPTPLLTLTASVLALTLTAPVHAAPVDAAPVHAAAPEPASG